MASSWVSLSRSPVRCGSVFQMATLSNTPRFTGQFFMGQFHGNITGYFLNQHNMEIPSGYVKIAIENGHRNSEFSHKKWWFSHSYVSLPEGIDSVWILTVPANLILCFAIKTVEDWENVPLNCTHQIISCSFYSHYVPIFHASGPI